MQLPPKHYNLRFLEIKLLIFQFEHLTCSFHSTAMFIDELLIEPLCRFHLPLDQVQKLRHIGRGARLGISAGRLLGGHYGSCVLHV
jgi:hypothetical protein